MLIDGRFVPGKANSQFSRIRKLFLPNICTLTDECKHASAQHREVISKFQRPLKYVTERWLKNELPFDSSTSMIVLKVKLETSDTENFGLRYGEDNVAASQAFAIGSRGCLRKLRPYF